jgi:hypothetical protein
MLLPSCHHWWFDSVLHPPVLQFFFNEKRYYVNVWLQLYYFFTRTPLLFSLAFVYTNRVIYLGFLINLFSLSLYVCVSYRRTLGVWVRAWTEAD